MVAERQILLFGLLTATLPENRQICQRRPAKMGIHFTIDRAGFFWLFWQSAIEHNWRTHRKPFPSSEPASSTFSWLQMWTGTISPRHWTRFLMEKRPHSGMTDTELEKLTPWSEEARIYCGYAQQILSVSLSPIRKTMCRYPLSSK